MTAPGCNPLTGLHSSNSIDRKPPNETILPQLTEGELDFGFITQRGENPAIMHQLFAREQYVLVGKNKNLIENIRPANLGEIPFINYPGMETLLDYWRQNYFPKKRNFNAYSMNQRGKINDLDGAITLVLHNDAECFRIIV